jgi:hypothetical protein
MASLSAVKASGAGTGVLLSACVAEHGSAAHPYFASAALSRGSDSLRNLADAIHFLCALHGRHPGVIDHAAGRTIESAPRQWLVAASDALVGERRYLARLAVAAGPVPSTPGGSASEAAVNGQRSALATLAQSDRTGCALGAAFGFALDWLRLRPVLDEAAKRLGLETPLCRLGSESEIQDVADSAEVTGSVERAMLFGAQQLALQHRGLWDLLEARAQARASS